MAEPAATQTEGKGAFARLTDVAVAALPPLLSIAGIVTFVALIGGAIQWVRFWAAGLPADQAVRAMPKAELVVIGAVSLIGFLLAGVLIALVVFLVERQALEEKVTTRVLLGLAVVEMGVCLFFLEDVGPEEVALLSAWFVALAVVTERALTGLPDVLSRAASRVDLWAARDRLEEAFDACADAESHMNLLPPRPDKATAAGPTDSLRAAIVNLQAAKRDWKRILEDWDKSKAREVARLPVDEPPTKWDVQNALMALSKRERKNPKRRAERTVSLALVLATAAAGAVPVALDDDLRWLLAVFAVVALLAAVNFMIARVSSRFAWYGIAVFASVALFGAALNGARTIHSPEVQPMALLRTSDDRPICGAYITETDDRVYVARVEAKSGDGAEQKLGRVFWIDLDDVETVSVGPLQKVDDANERLAGLAREVIADRPAKPAAAAKPAVTTTVVRRSRGRRTVTETTVTETPAKPAAASDAEPQGGPAEPTATARPAGAPGSCTPPSASG